MPERAIELKCGHFDWEKCSCKNNEPIDSSVRESQGIMSWTPSAGLPSYVRHNEKEICGFCGENRFLSNFWQAYVFYNGRKLPSTEHAFQFAKLRPSAQDEETYQLVIKMSPAEVKRWARKVELRPDWEKVKYDIMMAVVFDKFFRHIDLRNRLIETGERYLEETNTWRDCVWGVCSGQGTNWLGKILMRVRDVWRK